MAELRKLNSIYKNIIGNAKDTIETIQKYINKYNLENTVKNEISDEEKPAESINKILRSTQCEETNSEIQKIINNL